MTSRLPRLAAIAAAVTSAAPTFAAPGDGRRLDHTPEKAAAPRPTVDGHASKREDADDDATPDKESSRRGAARDGVANHGSTGDRRAEGDAPNEPASEVAAVEASHAAFADHLAGEGDYFRAISVYKELSFFTPDARRRAYYHYEIGKAYRLARRYELATSVLARLTEDAAAPPALVARAHLQAGLAALSLHSPGLAVAHFDYARAGGETSRASLFLGVVDFEAGRYGRARPFFTLAARGEPATARVAVDLLRASETVDRVPHRSPALAATLLAVLPGAGRVYTGYYVDEA